MTVRERIDAYTESLQEKVEAFAGEIAAREAYAAACQRRSAAIEASKQAREALDEALIERAREAQ